MNTYAYETSSKIGWYGSYNEETIGYCESYSFDIDLDSIDSILGISNVDSSTEFTSTFEADLNCGTGVILYSESKTTNSIENFNLGFLDLPQDENGTEVSAKLLRPPKQYFEKFDITKATESYEEVIGTYKLTSTFVENNPVYRHASKNWFIFYMNGRFRLANDLVRFTKGLIGQRDRPNGIFASQITDFDYAVSQGVEEITKKECKINARYLLRTSTGALFEKKTPIFLLPRIPRAIDEKKISEKSYADDPMHLEISNFTIATVEHPTIKYEPIITSKVISQNQLTITYDASTSDSCELTTPTKPNYQNNGIMIPNLLERYNAGYMTSDFVLDEPIQNKTILIENNPETLINNNKKVFSFDNKNDRQYINIEESIGKDVFNFTTGFSIYCKYKPSTSSSAVLLSKWKQTSSFVDPNSSFKLSTDAYEVNSNNGSYTFQNSVKNRKYNDLIISYDYTAEKLMVYINNDMFEINDFPRPNAGNESMIIGGYFSNTNQFAGFTGEIADLRIYSRPITNSEVDLIFSESDFESNKQVYSIEKSYKPDTSLKMQSCVNAETPFLSDRKFAPNNCKIRYSEDFNYAIAGEINSSSGLSAVSMTMRVFKKNDIGDYEYLFNKNIDNFDDFEFSGNVLVARNPVKYICYTIDFIEQTFSKTFESQLKNNSDKKMFISNVGNEKFLIILDVNDFIKILNISDANKPKVVKTDTGNLIGLNTRKITYLSVLGNVIATYGKNDNPNADYNINVVTIPTSANENINGYLNTDFLPLSGTTTRRLNKSVEDAKNGKLKLNETLPIEDISIKNLKLIEIDDELAIATANEKSNFSTAQYKTANRLGMQVGFLKIHKIDPSSDDVMILFDNTEISPTYDQFGNDFMENQSFGNEFASSGKNLLIASPNAIQNSDGTFQGLIYWYRLYEHRYNLVSRIFSVNDNLKNFGDQIFLNGNKLSVKSNQIQPSTTNNYPYAENFTLDTITDQDMSQFQKKHQFEQYDEEFNLLAWYRFNEIYSYKRQSNARESYALLDHSGNYNHLNCIFDSSVRQPNFTSPSELGMTYKFNKNSHCNVELDLSGDMQTSSLSGLFGNNTSTISKSFTINIWYLPTTFDNPKPVLVSVYEEDNVRSNKGFVLYANGDIMIGSDLNSVEREVSLVTETNRWYMMTMVYNDSDKEIQFYLNGKLEKKINETLILSSSILSIGGLTYTLNPFHGYIDDLKIYKKILTQEDIDYEFQKSWKFDNIKN